MRKRVFVDVLVCGKLKDLVMNVFRVNRMSADRAEGLVSLLLKILQDALSMKDMVKMAVELEDVII